MIPSGAAAADSAKRLALAVLLACAAMTAAQAQVVQEQIPQARNSPPQLSQPQDAPKCSAPAEATELENLPMNFREKIAERKPLKIVAIGSSSTFGTGATSPDKSYPRRLEAELKARLPGVPVTVLNKGIGGEEAPQMIARFDADVFEEAPDLVLWQVGTNSLLRDRPLDVRSRILQDGIAQLKSQRMDVVLMDPQYTPRVLAKTEHEAAVTQIASAAKEQKVGLMHRYDMMRRWYETDHLAFETFVTSDGLHMNDWGYRCLATSLGVAIADAATRPTETAVLPAAKR